MRKGGQARGPDSDTRSVRFRPRESVDPEKQRDA